VSPVPVMFCRRGWSRVVGVNVAARQLVFRDEGLNAAASYINGIPEQYAGSPGERWIPVPLPPGIVGQQPTCRGGGLNGFGASFTKVQSDVPADRCQRAVVSLITG
jgi:hypothetical protein